MIVHNGSVHALQYVPPSPRRLVALFIALQITASQSPIHSSFVHHTTLLFIDFILSNEEEKANKDRSRPGCYVAWHYWANDR